MNVNEFMKNYAKVGINGPSHRNAPKPPFEESKINESEFPDELRFKDVNMEVSNNHIYIDWEAQSWSDDYNAFFEEVYRCYKYLTKLYEVEGEIHVHINLFSRNSDNSAHSDKTIDEEI